MWIINAICIVIAILCIIQLHIKQRIDKSEQIKYQEEIQKLQRNKDTLLENITCYQNQLNEIENHFRRAQVENDKELARKANELNSFYDKTKTQRLEQLEDELTLQENKAKEILALKVQQQEAECNLQIDTIKQNCDSIIQECQSNVDKVIQDTQFQQERFNNLLTSLRQYEKDKAEKLFYTIQVPDEYKDDIDYLLNNVANKIQHPDIINKLVWSEYVKPYISDTFKRVGVESKSGIYKITNINDNKCYIGKSTDIKKRLTDHFKSSIGIRSIADQAVHHAILKQGFWNWMIEPVEYCDKEKLNEEEKYYINFFQSQIYGYNKTGGGEG